MKKDKMIDEVARIEEENEQACVKCAKTNGFTSEQANNCEEGELDCKGCPWNTAKIQTEEEWLEENAGIGEEL